MGRGDYERLTPRRSTVVDQDAGQSRAEADCPWLDLSTSTVRDYLHRCGRIRPAPRRRLWVGSRPQNARRCPVDWRPASR